MWQATKRAEGARTAECLSNSDFTWCRPDFQGSKTIEKHLRSPILACRSRFRRFRRPRKGSRELCGRMAAFAFATDDLEARQAGDVKIVDLSLVVPGAGKKADPRKAGPWLSRKRS